MSQQVTELPRPQPKPRLQAPTICSATWYVGEHIAEVFRHRSHESRRINALSPKHPYLEHVGHAVGNGKREEVHQSKYTEHLRGVRQVSDNERGTEVTADIRNASRDDGAASSPATATRLLTWPGVQAPRFKRGCGGHRLHHATDRRVFRQTLGCNLPRRPRHGRIRPVAASLAQRPQIQPP